MKMLFYLYNIQLQPDLTLSSTNLGWRQKNVMEIDKETKSEKSGTLKW